MEHETINLKQTKPGNLPYVSLYHNKTLYRFILDTGSTLSWTRVDVAAALMMEKESGYESMVVNGEKLNIVTATLRPNPCTDTPDDYTATKFRAKFVCGEGTKKINEMNEVLQTEIHGILGIDFLTENALKVDFVEQQLVI